MAWKHKTQKLVSVASMLFSFLKHPLTRFDESRPANQEWKSESESGGLSALKVGLNNVQRC